MADENRKDYVAEAYETFIKNASDLDPSDPVAAIHAYFDRNASDDLKARVKADGKTAKGCWTSASAEAPARQARPKKEKPKEKPKKAPKKEPKAKRPKFQQGFFFEMLEAPATTSGNESEVQG